MTMPGDSPEANEALDRHRAIGSELLAELAAKVEVRGFALGIAELHRAYSARSEVLETPTF